MPRAETGIQNQAILTLSCPDGPGIVATVSGFLSDLGCNILDSAQFGDSLTNRFFMRVQFDLGQDASLEEVQTGFAPLSRRLEMDHTIQSAAVKPRALIMLSKFDHCLADLLYRYLSHTLFLEIPLVVSNHEDARRLVEGHSIEFVYLPVTPETKLAQEKVLTELIKKHKVDVIILARYMQILSPEFVAGHKGRIINIHHSFLPGFKGARPYHRAHKRGVKLIGATAHFVTENLDEGQIIAQDVLPVDHKATPEDLIVAGRDVEARVLAYAIKMFSEQRILLNDGKTVVFT